LFSLSSTPASTTNCVSAGSEVEPVFAMIDAR
jgi:hypothetical protein